MRPCAPLLGRAVSTSTKSPSGLRPGPHAWVGLCGGATVYLTHAMSRPTHPPVRRPQGTDRFQWPGGAGISSCREEQRHHGRNRDHTIRGGRQGAGIPAVPRRPEATHRTAVYHYRLTSLSRARNPEALKQGEWPRFPLLPVRLSTTVEAVRLASPSMSPSLVRSTSGHHRSTPFCLLPAQWYGGDTAPARATARHHPGLGSC